MTEDFPYATLGLVVKNNEKTIGKTVESLLNIDYPFSNLEVIVVDGRSVDKTKEIITKGFGVCKFKWIMLSDDGKGLGYARELVVENAKGKYIIWVDGDHVLPSDYVKKHIQLMESYPKLAGAEAFVETARRNIVETLEEYFWDHVNRRRAKNSELKSMGSAGAIYRVSAVREAGGYDTEIKGACEDVDLSKRLLKRGWKLAINSRVKYTHLARSSWLSLWRQWFWYGYGGHYINHKYPRSVNIFAYLPPRTILSGFRLASIYYRMTGDPICWLNPIHKTWKCLAWLFGYFKAHLNNYGH